MIPKRSLVVVVALGVALGGCATAPVSALATLSPELRAPERLPPPDTSLEAQAYLTGAIAALRASQPKHATVFINAILRSDHLTERGRANVYWLSAEAYRLAGNDGGLADALGGFLVAAAVLDPDEDMRVREVEARATLVARRLKNDPHLGKSPTEAIIVEDARDPSGIVAELGCVEDTAPLRSEALEERHLTCRDGSAKQGAPLVLWFDLTHSH